MAKTPLPPGYPGNSKTLRRISVKELHDLEFGLPPKAKNLRLSCPNGHTFRPTWGEKLPFEYAPFEITLRDGQKAAYAPAAIQVPCTECRAATELSFPSVETDRGRLELFGDESYHIAADQKRYFFAYAFVGTYADGRSALEDGMTEFKLAIRPNTPPHEWVFHANEIRKPEWRARHGVDADLGKINAEMRKLANVLATNENQRAASVTVCPVRNLAKAFRDGRRPREGVRDLVLSFAIYTLTDTLTPHGFSPAFRLESVDNSANPEFMEMAVERLARSLFCNTNYLYVSRGMVTDLATTVGKGASVELEYADLLAFWVNRCFERRGRGLPTEMPLENFGPIIWGAFTDTRVGLSISTGFPWETFYPGF